MSEYFPFTRFPSNFSWIKILSSASWYRKPVHCLMLLVKSYLLLKSKDNRVLEATCEESTQMLCFQFSRYTPWQVVSVVCMMIVSLFRRIHKLVFFRHVWIPEGVTSKITIRLCYACNNSRTTTTIFVKSDNG